jgi:hypothetical protein
MTRVPHETHAFAVLMEVERMAHACFVTLDRAQAHEVFAEAQRREDENAKESKVEPARYTLIDCVTDPAVFYERVEEGF